MHNCRLTRSALIDLALDEMPAGEAKQMLSELNVCSACREEYATLRSTWRVSGQALQSVLPTEEFWPGYHARLQDQLIQRLHEENERAPLALESVPQSLNSPLWLRIWMAVWKLATTSVRVPVPVALALLLLFGISVFVRRARGPMETVGAAPSAQLPSVETRLVQVPVIQERVVTRVVYVEKKSSSSRGASNLPERDDLSTGTTAMSLVGFKPTDQVKLSIIKGNQDEK